MANVQRGLPAGPGGVQVPGGPGAPGVPGPQPPGAVQVGPATAQAVVSRPGGPAGIIHGAGRRQTIVLAGRPPAGLPPGTPLRSPFATARPPHQVMPAGMSPLRGVPTSPAVGAAGRPIQVPTVAGGGNLVINNPGLAPGQPGSQITVPLQSLQALKPGEGIPTGQANHLLVKTENNQYQILRVEPSAASPVVSGAPPTVMTTSSIVRPTLPTRPVGPPPPSAVQGARPPPSLAQRPTVTQPSSAMPPPSTVASAPRLAAGAPPKPATGASGGAGGGMGGQMTPHTAKHKCRNFLETLLKLAREQPAAVATNVRNLIQGLIDGKVEPELFTTKLQGELSSAPQPCLVPFLKKSLPYLQQSLASGELTIEGVRAPPPTMVPSLPPPQPRPTFQQPQVVRPGQVRPGASGASNVIYSNALPPGGQGPRVAQVPGGPRGVGANMRMTGTTATKIGGVTGAGGPRMVQRPLLGRPPGLNSVTSVQKLPHGVSPTGNLMLGKGVPSATTTTPGTSVTPLGKPLDGTFAAPSGVPSRPSPFGTSVVKKTTSINSSSATPTKSSGSGGGATSYSGGDGDDDINDVAAMGGVNLAEESQRMATDSFLTSSALRSCGKDETFLQTGRLHHRVARLCKERGLEDPPPEVINLVSHATQERLKTLLEKLSVIAEHRLDVVAASESGDRYDVTQNVRGQIKFLNELERIERKRHDEAEREALFRAAKSRTKTEDPEKERMRAKAKEMQRFEDEQAQQKQANNTAMLAIGGQPRKKLRLDGGGDSDGPSGPSGLGGLGGPGGPSGPSGGLSSSITSFGSATLANRPRLKRVHIRDLLFLMEQEKQTKRSPLLWKALCS